MIYFGGDSGSKEGLDDYTILELESLVPPLMPSKPLHFPRLEQ